MNTHGSGDKANLVLQEHFDPEGTGVLAIPVQEEGRHRRPDLPESEGDETTERIPKHRLNRRPRAWRTWLQVTLALCALVTVGCALGLLLPRAPETVNPATLAAPTSVVPAPATSRTPGLTALSITTTTMPPAPPPPTEEVQRVEMLPPVTRDPMPPCGPASRASLDHWLDQASQAIMAAGEREITDRDAVHILIRFESSGDPCAENLWDSNAARGTPSQGLIQAIGPTFRRWALPGFTEPFHPVDSIIAGVRYARGRYGSESSAPGVLSIRRGGSYVPY